MPATATQLWIWQKTLLEAMLGTLKSATTVALTVTPTLELITDNVPIIPEDAIANHTIADYTGYGAETLTLNGPVNDGTIGSELAGNALFVAGATTSTFNPNTITGVLLTDGSTTLYGGELFTSPVLIGEAGDYLDYTVLLPALFAVPAG